MLKKNYLTKYSISKIDVPGVFEIPLQLEKILKNLMALLL